MKNLWLIIVREYLTKTRNKSFIIMTFVTPLIVVLFSILIAYLSKVNNNSIKKVVIFDKSFLFQNAFVSNSEYDFQYVKEGNLEMLKKKSSADGDYGMLYIPDFQKETQIQFFSKSAPNPNFINYLTSAIEDEIFQQNLKKQNIDFQTIETSKEEVNILFEDYSGEKNSKISGILKMIFGMLAGYLLMMFIVIYGNMIMRSVIEEKTNRIIEIIVSSVKPMQLMLGKIFGTALVGLTQVAMWLIIGGILMTILTHFVGVTPSNPTPNLSTENTKIISEVLLEFFKFPIMKLIFSFLIFFIGGFLLYSGLYTAIGAAVDSETDTQQFLFPVLTPLMLAVYVAAFTVVDDPNGTISVLFSYIPLTSPITMLTRIPFGVSWVEIISSSLILYLTFFLILWFSSKIYRIGILSYGKKTTYKDLYKWLKQ